MALKFLLDYNDPRFLDGRLFKGGGGSAPAAPDPDKTAAAQSKYSKDTAIWNSALNNVNQITPFGNLTFSLGNANYNNNTPSATTSNNQSTSSTAGSYIGPDGRVYNFGGETDPNTGNPSWMKYYENTNNGSIDGLFREKAGMAENLYGSGDTEGLAGLGFTPLGTSGVNGSTSGINGTSGGSTQYGDLPQWTSQVNLSPESQAIFDSYMRQQKQLGGLSESALNQVGQAYASPYNYDSLNPLYGADDLNAARTRTEDAIYSRLNPQFQQDEEALRTRLINQGIGQGSEAYSREMNNFNQMKNDARMQAVLAGGTESDRAFAQSLASRQQGIGEIDKLRAQPLNEYLAMSGQQQLAMPQFQQYNYAGAGTPDYQGLVNQQYQSQLADYNANQASSNNMMGGLFGLGGQALGGFLGSPSGSAAVAGMFSDARLKDNIEHIGEENGFPVYTFNYKGDDKRFIGVMAQDVEQIMPDAVGERDGYKTVNYDMIGVEMRSANG